MRFSHVSKNPIPEGNGFQGSSIRKELFDFIAKKYPDFTVDSFLDLADLNHARKAFLHELIREAKLNAELISEKPPTTEGAPDPEWGESEEDLTIGQKVADKVASFGGSWAFILSFFLFILVWIVSNFWLLTNQGFDPYPFILLNLLLSCLAAIQAPVIMMSQNRKEQKDRLRSEYDYKINLKAELEIQGIHQKLDVLMQQNLANTSLIQEINMDLVEGLTEELNQWKQSANGR
jgi:uncharacterized membrane protein